jgi:penicillin-binding protein 2
MAVAGLEEGVIDENTVIVSTDYITAGNQRFHDFRAYGPVDVRRALAVSSNVFFYVVGGGLNEREGLGPERIKKYLSLFNFDGVSGIDLPGESDGTIPDPSWKHDHFDEEWYIGDTYNMSIGQGFVSITPLALALGMTAIANDGALLQPRVVKTIVDTETGAEKHTEVEILREDFVPSDYLQIVREGLRESVLSGYTQTLKDLPIAVAGKTGTAQTGGGQKEHAWYAVFAPYENPEIVMVFLAEHGGLGSDTVVPIAKEVLNWYFSERGSQGD